MRLVSTVARIEQADCDGVRIGGMHRDVDAVADDGDAQGVGRPPLARSLARPGWFHERSANRDWYSAM